ncbi:MAG: glutaredoxin family protein [Leptolyngbyaceae cyanobacterium SM2_5_2]|nr:glutaredoxin family protein [Leptolyngbyaceae cyanobacterium SM2_5_2]
MKFVLYSKPGCHLCEGLEEKLAAAAHLPFELEVRDITHRDDWFQRYQYEIPVLCQVVETPGQVKEIALPRLSPRASQARVEQLIQNYLGQNKAK